jgi:hypothetical protein
MTPVLLLVLLKPRKCKKKPSSFAMYHRNSRGATAQPTVDTLDTFHVELQGWRVMVWEGKTLNSIVSFKIQLALP